MVVVTEDVPPMLRGRLALWLLEVRAGVYVGSYSRKTRDGIWKEVCDYVGGGNAVMVWRSSTEAGFEFATVGRNRREPCTRDGRPSVRFLPLDLDLDEDNDVPVDLRSEAEEVALALSRAAAPSALETRTEAADEAPPRRRKHER